MSVKSNLLKWLKSSSQRKHRASSVEEEREEKERAKESEPKKKVTPSAEKAEGHQDPYEP